VDSSNAVPSPLKILFAGRESSEGTFFAYAFSVLESLTCCYLFPYDPSRTRESLPAGREDRAAGGGGSIFKKGTLPPVKVILVIVVLKGRVTKFKRRATPNNMSVSKKVNPTAEKCLNLEEYDRVSI
jgi:hypothetical protein